jgi:hypothetical protein
MNQGISDLVPDASIPESAAITAAEARQFSRRGLFIGGCPKSGTTLLLSLLDSHPQLAVLPEETFYLEKRGQYRALPGNREKLRFLLEKTNLSLLAKGLVQPPRETRSAGARNYAGFDYPRFLALAAAAVRQPWVDDSLLYSEVIRAYAIVLGTDWRQCVGWVEKSTSNEVRHAAMDELYPDARVVQLVRDPRAVFASRKKRMTFDGATYRKAHRLVREWNRSAREIPRLRRQPERFMVLRYEDLVKNPQASLQAFCRLAGIEFVPTLLKPTRAGQEWLGNSSFQGAFHEINSAPVDQWKDYLTDDEVWWIELHCRQGMALAGYTLQTGGRFSLRRWLKRLPGESWNGYLRARRGSLCQWLGLLKECRYGK